MGNHLNFILSEWLFPDPTETPAPALDCGTCSMSDQDVAHGARWRDYKCCAFQPFFPNFYLGALLQESPRELESGGVHLGPLGLVARREFRDLCAATPDVERGPAHLCQFYDRGLRRCDVWKFRPGECSTYYCRPVPGMPELSAKTFALESAVAQMAMAQLGFSPAQISAEVDTLNTGVVLRRWEKSAMLEVYRQAYAWSRGLNPEEIQQWLDFDILGKV